jgi:hypothetical protein
VKPLVIEVSFSTLLINNQLIPLPPTKDKLISVLGNPSRISRSEHGVVYTFDDMGLTFRTDLDRQNVSDVRLYFQDIPINWKFAPIYSFDGTIKICNVSFIKDKKIVDIQKFYPNLEPNKELFLDFLHELVLGELELNLYINTRSLEIRTLTISVSEEYAE